MSIGGTQHKNRESVFKGRKNRNLRVYRKKERKESKHKGGRRRRVLGRGERERRREDKARGRGWIQVPE